MQTQSPSNITHKPADLISDEVDFLDERNKQNTRLRSENAADMTPPKGVTQQPALISPSPSVTPFLLTARQGTSVRTTT
jgi:hypothetical protein